MWSDVAKNAQLVRIPEPGSGPGVFHDQASRCGIGIHGANRDVVDALASDDPVVQAVGGRHPSRRRVHVLVYQNAASLHADSVVGDQLPQKVERAVVGASALDPARSRNGA